MPFARKEIANATIQLDGKIYVVGGVAGTGEISDALEIFDIHNNTWNTGAFDSFIYSIGGSPMAGV